MAETIESSEFAPNDIILKRYSGEEKVFKGVDVVRLTHASNEYTVPYTFGEAVENIPITLDLKDGDQTVTAPDGTLVKSAVISKPVNLTPENIRSGKTIAGVTGKFAGDTEELTVDLNFPEYTPETDILAETRFATSYISEYGAYGISFGFTISRPLFPLALGDKCVVVWDESEYEVTVGDSSTIMPDTLYVGNGSGFGLPGNAEPFAIAWDSTGVTILSTVDTEWTEHTIRIYQSGSSPNQVIVPSEEGKALSKVTVTKPETLVPENVRSGIDVGGVVGSFLGDTEEATVELNFANGTQTVEPSAAGKVLSAVNILKPDTLLPENIAEGIDIAGIIGTFAGGGKIKISSGTFAGSANIVTVTHGLGVVPLMFGCVESYPLGTPTQYINYLHGGYVGFSSACMENNTVTRIGYCCTNYYGSSHNLGYRSYTTANQAIDGTSGVVHSANEQTLKVGTTASANSSLNTGGVRTNSNATYYWFAIGIA